VWRQFAVQRRSGEIEVAGSACGRRNPLNLSATPISRRRFAHAFKHVASLVNDSTLPCHWTKRAVIATVLLELCAL